MNVFARWHRSTRETSVLCSVAHAGHMLTCGHVHIGGMFTGKLTTHDRAAQDRTRRGMRAYRTAPSSMGIALAQGPSSAPRTCDACSDRTLAPAGYVLPAVTCSPGERVPPGAMLTL